jgi:hypothetical protein
MNNIYEPSIKFKSFTNDNNVYNYDYNTSVITLTNENYTLAKSVIEFDIDYYLPSINGQKNVEMNLMICQDLDDTSIEGALLIELITKIYNQVYQNNFKD